MVSGAGEAISVSVASPSGGLNDISAPGGESKLISICVIRMTAYTRPKKIEVCQSQPVKIPWRPLRLLVATIIYLRGLVKREDIVDIDLLPCDDDFFDQALYNRLAIGKGEAIEILA